MTSVNQDLVEGVGPLTPFSLEPILMSTNVIVVDDGDVKIRFLCRADFKA